MEEMSNTPAPAEITKSRCGKPQTRLQKRAPAALRLDEITAARNLESYCHLTASSACVIPLLSPLVLSPAPTPPPLPHQEAAAGINDVVGQGRIFEWREASTDPSVSTAAITGWQHPAATALAAEPSTLFAFFQTQCSLVQPTPTQ